MSVASLGINDFERYYRGAIIANPENGKMCMPAGSEGNDVLVTHTKNASKYDKVSLNKFQWAHVKPPRFGYRTFGDGSAVVFFSRRPGAQRDGATLKGLHAGVIRSALSPSFKVVLDMFPRHMKQSSEVLTDIWRQSELIYNQEFTPFRAAVGRLLSKTDDAIAFAVNHDFAVTVWGREQPALVLYYAGCSNPCASSNDGFTWTWHNKAAQDAATRMRIM